MHAKSDTHMDAKFSLHELSVFEISNWIKIPSSTSANFLEALANVFHGKHHRIFQDSTVVTTSDYEHDSIKVKYSSKLELGYVFMRIP